MHKDFLLHMKSHAFFEDFKKHLLSERPDVPSYNCKDDNTELWKYQSAKREGYDLLLTYLQIGVDDD